MAIKVKFSEILILVICTFFVCVQTVSFEDDTRVTARQAEILAKFRQRMLPVLTSKYMQENIFLVRWLRARNFDIDNAERMLLQHLKWRRDNRLNQIDNEDWQDFDSEFPWALTGSDKYGRPLVQIVLRDWDIRKAAVTGRMERLIRWTYKFFEDGSKQVRKVQETGKNVTQFTLMLDAEGFNPVTHGCPLCMPLYFAISNIYEEHYPGAVDKINVVNTPEFFRVIIRLVWPILSQDTRNALKMHGTDRKRWRKILENDINNNELLQNFGGTIKNY